METKKDNLAIISLDSNQVETKKDTILFTAKESQKNILHKVERKETRKKSKYSKLKTNLKECLKEWCLDTTSHGFSNMVKADIRIIRLAWVILVVSLTTYCFYSK